ncbi:MAG: M28 family peptidase, partial [Gemmatimonadaceae bacterium]
MSELLAGALDALATRASWLEYVDVHVAFTSTNTRMTVSRTRFMVAGAIAGMAAAPLAAQTIALTGTPSESTVEQIRTMVSRLNLEQYKATVKGLTQFGDRRQGTDRNRHAVDWIEAELKSYGCTPTGRITYDFQPPPPRPPLTPEQIARFRAMRTGTNRPGPGGSLMRGTIDPTGVNTDSMRQADPALRALDTPQSVAGERQEVYCTKVGTVHPDEMYIVSGHMDGIGWGEAANDDGSGTALVMQLARVFSSPDIKTDRSIRFILWNNEETGLNGSKAYVEQRAALQGKEDPVGSGKYPEPKWLGVIQHDMEMFD